MLQNLVKHFGKLFQEQERPDPKISHIMAQFRDTHSLSARAEVVSRPNRGTSWEHRNCGVPRARVATLRAFRTVPRGQKWCLSQTRDDGLSESFVRSKIH